MKTTLLHRTATTLLSAAVACLSGSALADTYDMTWNTVDGGGAVNSAGGQYVVSGTIGQPDAGHMSGGVYSLTGGFWATTQTTPDCYGDLNNDQKVDLADLAILLSHYGQTGVPADFGDLNGDGNVDLSDLAAILSVYGTIC